MNERIEVCEAAQLGPGDRRIVERGPASIGVFNIEGTYYALSNICPHQHGPLCTGELSRKIEAEHTDLGRFATEFYADEYMIVCPWHAWAFDIETGEHVGDQEFRVPTFDVIVEDGTIYVEP